MRSVYPVLLLSALLTVWTGCGTEVNEGINVPGEDYYVDAAAGSDANPGTEAAPFKTITHALDTAVLGDHVLVAPGRYDAGHGEAFPLIVPEGVTLIGDEAGKGEGDDATLIEGAGMTSLGSLLDRWHTVVVLAQATIAGFFVSFEEPDTPAPQGLDTAVWLRGNAATIRNCRIDGPGTDSVVTGILVGKYAGVLAQGCCVRFCRMGVDLRAGVLEHSVVQLNHYGVTTASGDLGGGALGGEGGNALTSNDMADLVIPAGVSATIFALDNTWDHAPPTFSIASELIEAPPGTDIWNVDGVGSVVWCVGACPN